MFVQQGPLYAGLQAARLIAAHSCTGYRIVSNIGHETIDSELIHTYMAYHGAPMAWNETRPTSEGHSRAPSDELQYSCAVLLVHFLHHLHPRASLGAALHCLAVAKG